MDLREKIQNPAHPVVFYEMIPPKLGDSGELEQNLSFVAELCGVVDAINIPEVREETRQGARPSRLPERIEPRLFAKAIHDSAPMQTVVNRVTVHDTAAEQRQWLQESYDSFGVRSLILVGGESHKTEYAGPSVTETASLSANMGLDFSLGGITIPSRSQEAARIRRKYQPGLRFFTTQVLFDSNDIVDLIQNLNGLDVAVLLSFAPISNTRDVEFLKWLGVDVPKNVSWSIAKVGDAEKAVERSIAQACKILADVFDNLPAHPPAIGLNVEQITRRNHGPARQMLELVGTFYRRLVRAHYAAPEGVAPAIPQ